jgi:hypothetical protein
MISTESTRPPVTHDTRPAPPFCSTPALIAPHGLHTLYLQHHVQAPQKAPCRRLIGHSQQKLMRCLNNN